MKLAIRSLPDGFDPKTQGPVLLFFVMEGCPWCIRLKPVMNQVAATLGSVIPAYKVDAGHPLARTYGVSGFPTIVYVDNTGASFTYRGERTVDAITGFVCSHTAAQNSICTKYRR